MAITCVSLWLDDMIDVLKINKNFNIFLQFNIIYLIYEFHILTFSLPSRQQLL